MKHSQLRFAKLRERSSNAARTSLPKSRTVWSRLNSTEVLVLALCEYLEHEVLPSRESSPKAEILVEAIHDWKEELRNGG